VARTDSTTVLDAANCYRCSVVCLSVCLSISVSVRVVCKPYKTAEPIQMPFLGSTRVGPKNRVSLHGATRGRHMANTIDRSVLGGDRVVATITCY